MNKKAFQSNTNHPLSDSLYFIVNKFECVWEVGGGCTVRSKLNGPELGKGGQSQDPVQRTGWDWPVKRMR